MQWKKERDNLSKNVKLFFGLWKKKKPDYFKLHICFTI